jgi:DnaJ-class molecular chaperone
LTTGKKSGKIFLMTMINDDPKKQRFVPFKCPNCNGYGTVSYGKRICPVCHGKGIVIIDQETGLPVNIDDDDKKEA